MRGFLLLILIGLVGYNGYETWTLRSEVAQLQRDLRAARAGKHTADSEEVSEAPSLLESAREHAAEAQHLLHLGDYEKARKEITDGARSFERANAAARADGDKILGQLREAAQALSPSSDPPKTSRTEPPSRTGN